MNPTFETILHSPEFANFRTPGGKICITKHRVPRPCDENDTTVPSITYNGVSINPPKLIADRMRNRTPEELAAFHLWHADVKERQRSIAARVEQERQGSEERKKQDREHKQEVRKESAKHAKSLIWWISYQAGPDGQARFDGSRTLALQETCRLLQLSTDWQAYCNANNIASDIIKRDEEDNNDDDAADDEAGDAGRAGARRTGRGPGGPTPPRPGPWCGRGAGRSK